MADSEILTPTVFISSENSTPIYVYPVNPPSTSSAARTKRRQVKVACTNCQRACKKCDEARPCLRCVKYGVPHTCVDAKRKTRRKGLKRGPYKKDNKNPLIKGESTVAGPVSPPLPDPCIQETPATSSVGAFPVPEDVDYPATYQHFTSTPQPLTSFHQKETYYQSPFYILPSHHEQHRLTQHGAEHLAPVYPHQQEQTSYYQHTYPVHPAYEPHPSYTRAPFMDHGSESVMVQPYTFQYSTHPTHEAT
ncbi:hypothetical protein L218DRAFT_1080772 [Marasmius fiardii PR-910]|nr:hypothetical protein L218DRAFT_1080772 [Marasmius fiardii PR-910]